MRSLRVAFLLLALLAAGGTTRAEDRFGLGIKAGTLGLGVELTGKATNWFDLRASLNQYNLSKSFTKSDIDYDGDFKLGGTGVLLDFHPFRNRFRLTGGVFSNRMKVELASSPTQTISIGNNNYTPQQVGTLSGTLKFRSTAPYVGIGYGSAARGPGRIGFVLDLGVLSQGRPDFTLSASGGQVTPSDLQQEASQVQDDSKRLKLWPVLALGISFRL